MVSKTGTVKGIVFLALATLFWAANYMVAEAAVEFLNPANLVFWRWAVAVIPLFVIAQVFEKPKWKDLLKQWPWLLLLSVLGLAGYNLLLYTALEYIPAFEASLINAFSPAAIAIAAAIFLRQRLGGSGVLGVLIALVGVLVVVTGGDFTALASLAAFGPGQLFMVGAVAVWAAYTIIGRVVPPMPPIASTAIQGAIAVALMLPLTVATGGIEVPSTAPVIWSVIFIGIFPSVLAYICWNKALTVIPPARAGVFLNLVAVYTAMFTLLGGRALEWTQVAGGLLVVAGVLVTNSHAFRRHH